MWERFGRFAPSDAELLSSALNGCFLKVDPLNGALLRDDLVDEVFLSVAPLMGGGSQRGIARGEIPNIHELELRHVLTEDHFLFLRYTRATATPAIG